jgi:hypothetical protein
MRRLWLVAGVSTLAVSGALVVPADAASLTSEVATSADFKFSGTCPASSGALEPGDTKALASNGKPTSISKTYTASVDGGTAGDVSTFSGAGSATASFTKRGGAPAKGSMKASTSFSIVSADGASTSCDANGDMSAAAGFVFTVKKPTTISVSGTVRNDTGGYSEIVVGLADGTLGIDPNLEVGSVSPSEGLHGTAKLPKGTYAVFAEQASTLKEAGSSSGSLSVSVSFSAKKK